MDSESLSVKILKAMGHPIRLKIVKFLLDKPHCVCELKENLDFSQPNLSQHLKILKEAGIIASEKVEVQTHYHVCLKNTEALIAAAEAMSQEYLNQFK